MPELWDQLTQQPVAEPPSLWPQGDRAPLRITVGGPTMKDGAQASSGSSLDPFNPPQVEYVGKPLARTLESMISEIGRKGQGLFGHLMNAEAERTGQAPTVSTDYDPQSEAVKNATDLASYVTMAPSVTGGVPGSVGMGIRAYHSSPHDFDRFDLSKLGTGQGANSYGKGFYAAENPMVSGQGGEYWQEFARHPALDKTQRDAAEFLALHNFDRQKAAQQTRAQFERAVGGHPISAEQTEFEKIVRLLESDKQVGPRTYELNIKADPKQFLQWDKTLAEQPHIVEALPGIADAVKQEAHGRALSATTKPRADELWSMVKDPMQAPANFGIQRFQRDIGGDAMDAMRNADIPGVRYADQGTRQVLSDLAGAEKAQVQMSSGGRKDWGAWREEIERLKAQPQTYNYVINDPSIIDILKKYALLGVLAPGLAAQFAPQQQGRAQ